MEGISSYKVIVHPRYKKAIPFLYNLNGEVINLHGIDHIVDIPVSPSNPKPKTKVYRAATENELISIYNDCIKENSKQDFLIIDTRI